MTELFIKVVVNGAALLAAANIVPEFRMVFSTSKPEDWLKVAVIALVFAIVNSYLKPILKLLTMPIGFLTMGLIAFAINAGMLLGTAWIVWQADSTLKLGLNFGFQLGSFPPTWSYDAIGVAVVASIVISVVATVLELLLLPRKVLGL
jgi:putative membrane protein